MTKHSDFKDVVRARMATTGERYTQALTHVLADDSGGHPAKCRIIAVERRYAAAAKLNGQRRLQPQEVMRYLFRRVVVWGRSSNVYLENGSRLYTLPGETTAEYATPECDSARTATIHAFAGDRRFAELVASASTRLWEEGIRGELSATPDASEHGGQHESYSVATNIDRSLISAVLVPFLVTRQLFAGPRGEVDVDGHRLPVLSPRAERIWMAISEPAGPTALADPDAPAHADPDVFRRLHISVGDVHPSPAITFVTLGTTALVLRLLEEAPHDAPRSITLERPLLAMREISRDTTMRGSVRLADGRAATAKRIQQVIFEAVTAFGHGHGTSNEERRAIAMWGRALDALERHPDPVTLDDAVCTDKEIETAMYNAPDTRARLRSEFIKTCRTARRDYTVDWVHLKLNDAAQRTILLKDPFRSEDERVERLLASIRDA